MKFSNEYCGRFSFFWDMNADGLVTISDVFQWFNFLFYVPAKIAMFIVSDMPPLATFFEINCHTGEGWGGAIFSMLVWSYAVEKLLKRA